MAIAGDLRLTLSASMWLCLFAFEQLVRASERALRCGSGMA